MEKRIYLRIAAMFIATFLFPTLSWAIDGSGTQKDPYLVETGGQLDQIRLEIAQNKFPNGVFIKLINDIWLTDSFIPLGDAKIPFSGTFNGNLHTINRLNLNYKTSNQGLFGVVETCTIKDFTLNGTMTSSESNVSNIGTVVGLAKSNIIISNIYSNVNININGVAQHHIGGIVGSFEPGTKISSEIYSCQYAGVIKAGNSTDCIGGIVGYVDNNTNTDAKIMYCNSIGSIYTNGKDPYIGGIMGYINDENKSFGGIIRCFSRCGLHYAGSNKFVGGIAGRVRSSATRTKYNACLTDSCGGKAFTTASETNAKFDDSNIVVTYAQCKSGYVTYYLNENTEWQQKLNTDNYPVKWEYIPAHTFYKVYKYQDKYCNGTTKGEVYYTNSNINSKTYHKGVWVERVEPNCTSTGNIRHYHCNICNKNYSSETSSAEIADVTLPIKHELDGLWEWASDHESAKCTVHCTREDCSYISSSATARVADGTIKIIIYNATCTSPRIYKYTATLTIDNIKYTDTQLIKSGSALGHNFVDGKCTRCGEGNYLTFKSTGTSTIKLVNHYNNNPSIQISLDEGNTWTNWNFSTITLAEGEKVQMRGNNPNGFSNTVSNLKEETSYSTFVMTGKLTASGNLMSLIDNLGVETTIPNALCFVYLFKNCTSLVKAPSLTATTLANNCYKSMFANCSNLTDVEVSFIDWADKKYTDQWMDGVAANGTFRCQALLPEITGSGYIPEGWRISKTYEKGDINRDGYINVADITALINYLPNGLATNPLYDVNGDSYVDKYDVKALIKLILNK